MVWLPVTNECPRCVAHRVIPGSYETPRRGVRTTVYGEKRMFRYLPILSSCYTANA